MEWIDNRYDKLDRERAIEIVKAAVRSQHALSFLAHVILDDVI